MKLRTYKKELEYSYALGASPAIELLKNRPQDCFKVMLSPLYSDKNGKIKELCGKYKIECEENQKIINILSPKENCYVAAAFKKRAQNLDADKSHVVLDNPSDMGNLGSIIRSCAGFGINNIAIIGSGADVYNPKAVRASMGAFFHVNAQYFKSVNDYMDYVRARIARPRNAQWAFPTDNFSPAPAALLSGRSPRRNPQACRLSRSLCGTG